jgi:large subunit ribosomal protein L9
MKVFLKQDVAQVGFANQIVQVKEGFARNFLIPHDLAVEITPDNEKLFAKKIQKMEYQKEALQTVTSMLSEKIKHLKLVLKKKIHDNGELYGSVTPTEVVKLLEEQGVSVSKNQIEMSKIKKQGSHTITVKLSSRLQPTCTLHIISE